jgi:hypothetical protein
VSGSPRCAASWRGSFVQDAQHFIGRIFVRDQDVDQAASRRADVGEGFPCALADSYSERDLPYLPEIQAQDPLVEFQRNDLALEGDVRADY